MKRAKPYDWLRLKAAYITGDVESVASWFEQEHPEITSDTYEKKTKGWRDERRAYAVKANELAIKKAVNKRADMLARHAAAGQLLQNVALQALVDKDGNVLDSMKPANSDQVARLAKAGADIEREALQAEDIPPGLGVDVGVEIATADIEAIRVFARAYGRRKALGRTD